MTYVRVERTAAPATVFQTVFRFLKEAVARKKRACGELTSRLTDQGTLQAIAGLSDEQLDDIGVCRKERHRRSDYLARSPNAERTVTFDYFRVDG